MRLGDMNLNGYLDHNATTPVDPRVLEAMQPYFGGQFGNPSSRHRYGRLARSALDTAREQVAALVGAHPGQLLFTSGGTESNHLALRGALQALPPAGLACSAVEHPSLLRAAAMLEGAGGWRLSLLPVDDQGRVAGLSDGIDEHTRLVSVMLANNETGVIQDLGPVVAAAERVGAMVHTDAVQMVGKERVDFKALGVQLMSLSAHKLYGPKGVGALVRDRAVDLTPVLPGGGQESGLRGGTENLPGIVGFGRAAELALAELDERRGRVRALRDELERGLSDMVGVVVFGADAPRLPNTVMFAVEGIEGETLLMELDRQGLALSSGSACAAGSTDPSYVLSAMGVVPDLARGALRVSLGKDNDVGDVQRLLRVLGETTVGLKQMMALGAGW